MVASPDMPIKGRVDGVRLLPSDPDDVLEWLSMILADDQWVEVRAFIDGDDTKTNRRIFAPEERAAMIRHALGLSGRYSGIYFTINPIRPGTKGSAKAKDIARRRLLLIDVDPERDPAAKLAAGDGAKLSTTDAEKAQAVAMARDIAAYLEDLGWPSPIEADSGNGAHLLYAIDLPNDARAGALVKSVLRELARRFDTADAAVDQVVHDASRITKFYGTLVMKGTATGDRPHRLARVLSIPADFADRPVTREQLQALIPPEPKVIPIRPTAPAPAARVQEDGRWPDEARAVAYLQTCDPAISGAKGHSQLLKVCIKVGPGFDIPPEKTFDLVWQVYNDTCQPPWSEADVRRKVEQAFIKETRRGFLRDVPRKGADPKPAGSSKAPAPVPPEPTPEPIPPPEQPQPRFNLTDLGNAERLVFRHGADLRYCHAWKRWLVWDGRRWAIDQTAAARRKARETVRSIYAEATEEDDPGTRKAIAKHAMDSEKRDRISGMLSLAEAEEHIPVTTEELDSDPWVFNCRNGTIDLKTGRLRPHRRADLLSKMSPVDFHPDAECPLWDQTLDLFFAGDRGLINYFQAICGYALAGVIRDHIMPVAYGDGGNGKSTMFGTLLEVFGPDYSMKCPPDMLMLKGRDSHPTDRADLFGKRLVVAIETEEGKRLNETMVKELTGGDKIRARRMREDFWEFHPTHTILLATNHKPVIKNTDNGIWRRLRLLPFEVKVEGDKDDKTVADRLKAEYPGILAWCVRGCIRWQASGLGEPAKVTEASNAYRKQQDTLGAFFDECCLLGKSYRIKTSALIGRYKKWCEDNNEMAISGKAFGMAMEQRGIEMKPSHGKWYIGIQTRAEPVKKKADEQDPTDPNVEVRDENYEALGKVFKPF